MTVTRLAAFARSRKQVAKDRPEARSLGPRSEARTAACDRKWWVRGALSRSRSGFAIGVRSRNWCGQVCWRVLMGYRHQGEHQDSASETGVESCPQQGCSCCDGSPCARPRSRCAARPDQHNPERTGCRDATVSIRRSTQSESKPVHDQRPAAASVLEANGSRVGRYRAQERRGRLT